MLVYFKGCYEQVALFYFGSTHLKVLTWTGGVSPAFNDGLLSQAGASAESASKYEYIFLACFLPWEGGGCMEERKGKERLVVPGMFWEAADTGVANLLVGFKPCLSM